ncbi:hypothetical protein MESS4_750049 [Mesorhizobium sp. STM 4661]|nr:hypothetical protein MESS4_750049 [Mesorhizobium sp. STM 4661]
MNKARYSRANARLTIDVITLQPAFKKVPRRRVGTIAARKRDDDGGKVERTAASAKAGHSRCRCPGHRLLTGSQCRRSSNGARP